MNLLRPYWRRSQQSAVLPAARAARISRTPLVAAGMQVALVLWASVAIAVEPNDTVATATFMGTGSFNAAQVVIGDGAQPDQDVDIYAIDLPSAAVIRADVWSDRLNWPLDPVLRLRDCADPSPDPARPDPCALATSDDAIGLGRDAQVTTVVLEPRTIYFMVSGAQNRSYDPTVAGSGVAGSQGEYELSVLVTPFDPGGVNEPNDSMPMASQLGSLFRGRADVLQAEGFLGDGPFGPTRGDRDFYEFTVGDGARPLVLELATASIESDLDAVVTVYDERGKEIVRRESLDGFVDLSVLIPSWCVGPYSYEESEQSLFVLVSSVGKPPPDDVRYPIPGGPTRVFDYTGTPSIGPYRLTVRTGGEVMAEVEPNDTIPTAMSTGLVNQGVYVGHAYSGNGPCWLDGSDGSSDLDMWSFEITDPPVVMTARVSSCPGYDSSFHAHESWYYVHLLDDSGAPVADFVDFTDFGRPPSDPTFQVVIKERGTYYVALAAGGIGYSLDTPPYDPFVACSSGETDAFGEYDMTLSLEPTQSARLACDAVSTVPSASSSPPRLQVTTADAPTVAGGGAFDLEVERVETGGLSGGGGEGLASDGNRFYFMKNARYPEIAVGYTGTRFPMWIGSGYYSDITELGGKLFVLDYMEDAIHVLHPADGRFECTIPVGDMNGIKLAGGLASLAGPNRLYAADAFNTRNVYELDLAGHVTDVFRPLTKRPVALAGIAAADASQAAHGIFAVGEWESNGVDLLDRKGSLLDVLDLPYSVAACGSNGNFKVDGDADRDGDLDLVDVMELQRCFGLSGDLDEMCAATDLTGDGRVNLADVAVFAMSVTGP